MQAHYSERVAEELARIEARGPVTHKQMTAHLRNRFKREGIKVRVQMQESCGCLWIKVFGVTFEQEFSEHEQRTIRTIAKTNGLTWVQGMEIDPEQMTNYNKGFDFLFHGPKYDNFGGR